MYNIEHLKMLVFAADLGSFSACARKLGKVQSAVSQGINNLEIDLDIQLFDRSTRKPTLTTEGERIYECAKAILQQSFELEKVAESIHEKEEKIIKIAVDKAVQTPLFNKALQNFSQQYPYTQIELLTIASTDIVNSFYNDNIDVGIMFSDLAFKHEVEICYVGNIKFYPVCHPSSPLADLSIVNDNSLLPYRQIVLRGEQGKELQQFISFSKKLWWSNAFDSMLSMVEQNIGWAYLPSYMVEEKLKEKKLCKIKVSFDHKPWNLPVDIVTKRGNAKGPALSWLFNELKKSYIKLI
ncbi:LysR family transcriptional regulator [Parashewanella tropica]|uniref:LysR family transcriptional regulator n=1 Tax=Parashewanella tropica TaxID=2547970 RepID=UPI001C554892|nr:LysR family transcriptional regulator [Parashewanella tropica]